MNCGFWWQAIPLRRRGSQVGTSIGFMKALSDFLPVVLFFVVYKMSDIYMATAVLIAASAFQVALAWIRHRHVERNLLITFGVILVFGGATLILRDPGFIKLKPTIANWIIAGVFMSSQMFTNRSVIRRMMEDHLRMPDPIWARLNLAWVGFFITCGFLNLWVANNFSESTWVNFKLFGLIGLNIVFVIGQFWFLSPYIQEIDPEAEPVPAVVKEDGLQAACATAPTVGPGDLPIDPALSGLPGPGGNDSLDDR